MSGSGITVAIDGVADISSQIVSAAVTLRAAAMGDSATVETNDPGGLTEAPARDAGMRIVIADIEVFRGRVVRVEAEGTDTGRTLRLIGAAAGNPPPVGQPSLMCIWGQNLVSWSLAVALEPPADALDAGVLTLTSHPAIRPGMTVTVAGARALFDGEYIVDTVTHTFNLGGGFSTSLRVRRA